MTTQPAGHDAVRFRIREGLDEGDRHGQPRHGNGVGVEKLEDAIVRSAEQVAGQIRAAKEAIATVIYGQDRVIENTLVTILSGGHALLIGVPGLAKTKLVETLGITLGLDAKRIQFTPDLMPSDILGAEVLDESNSGKRSFRFIAGPVFAQLLMADEINRASPRTQSALLQAMQEQHITVAGARHDLPKPFHVLATQNPLEQEGTYPLPEAQLDRFLMEIDVDYPDRDAERRILFETTGADETLAKASMNAEILIAAQRLVRRLPVGDSVVEAILSLVRSARPNPDGDERKADRLGTGPARQPVADAGGARPRAARRPPRALDRRRARSCRARAQAPHGADLLGARRGPHHSRRDQAVEDADRLMAADDQAHQAGRFQRSDVPMAKAERSPRRCRVSCLKPAASPPTSSTACMAAAAPAPAKVSGSIAASSRASRRRTSTGGARRATIIFMSASRNGRPRIPCGCGRTARHRWPLPRRRRATPSWSAA